MVKTRIVRLGFDQRGQLGIEMVLLLALTVAIFVAVSSVFRQKQILANFIARPWTNISAMIQNGVWDPAKPHPATFDRVVSIEGDLE